MATISDFAVDASTNMELGSEFVKKMEEGVEKLVIWFNEKGYRVTSDEAAQLIRNNNLTTEKQSRVLPLGPY